MINNEKPEELVEKHALLEALFQTQFWSEPYVKNPFMYVTDHDSDFAGERGTQLKDHLKKMFYMNYRKYEEIIDRVTKISLNNEAAAAESKFVNRRRPNRDPRRKK